MMLIRVAMVLPWAFFTATCNTARPLSEPPDTPLPAPAGDTFFTGCAFLDQNANGLVDSEDTPIERMSFVITLTGGTGFGAATETTGCATVTIPARLGSDAWPVVTHMNMPPASTYVPVGDSEITLSYPDTRANFLFALP